MESDEDVLLGPFLKHETSQVMHYLTFHTSGVLSTLLSGLLPHPPDLQTFRNIFFLLLARALRIPNACLQIPGVYVVDKEANAAL